MQCNSCFGAIEDQRKKVPCTACGLPLHRDCALKKNEMLYCDLCFTKEKKAKNVVEFELPPSIRRTYIETYRSCPHKFFHEVLKGNEAPATCHTEIGIDLHELFDKAVNDRGYHITNMFDDFKKVWDNKYPPMNLFKDEEQKQDMWQRAQDSIETFYEVLPSIPMPFTSEETIHFNIGDDIPDVEFTMDLVTENAEGGLDMHDWKTGRVMAGMKLSTDLQAPLYIYGVQMHFKRRVDRFTFYYLKEKKTRVFERINDDNYVCRVGKREYKINLTDAIREVKTIFSHIKKGNFNVPHDTKKMFFACKMCHLPEAGLCRGAYEESWHRK